jgi:2-C-methyl-D-erythritol 2,4-cyclodiphosphate synthase
MTMAPYYRVGHGFDVHRFRRGRKFILGGVKIPYAFGLEGHSDADVLIHALMNALLGAMGKGDIGVHFPDTDSRYKGISSEKLLARVLRMVDREGLGLVNGDITLLVQKPRLAPFFPEIKKNLSRLLGVPPTRLNIKAVTTEGLGWVGQRRGMAATAVVLLQKKRRRVTK